MILSQNGKKKIASNIILLLRELADGGKHEQILLNAFLFFPISLVDICRILANLGMDCAILKLKI